MHQVPGDSRSPPFEVRLWNFRPFVSGSIISNDGLLVCRKSSSSNQLRWC